MKIVYNIFYSLAVIVLLIAVLGGSATKSLFDALSIETLEFSGIKREYVDSADDKIDDIFYSAKRVELQIEKLKNLFSQDNVDESKYKRVNNFFIYETFYKPLIEMLNYVYRIFFSIGAVFLLLFGIIFHLIYKSFDLRRRVRKLEDLLLAQNK